MNTHAIYLGADGWGCGPLDPCRTTPKHYYSKCPCLLFLPQRLTFLDVSDNVLDVLPSKFADLKWLRVARLSRNQVVDMRPFVGLTACEELDLSQNKITQIPDTISRMTSLVTLDLSHNDIKDIPTGVCNVRRLNVRSFGEISSSSSSLASSLSRTSRSLVTISPLTLSTPAVPNCYCSKGSSSILV